MLSSQKSLVFAILVLVAASIGCGGPSVKEKLVGKWQGTLEIDEAAVKAKKPEMANPIVMGMMKMVKIQVEFKEDGTMASTMEGAPLPLPGSEGKWVVKSQKGQSAVLEIEEKKGKTEQTIVLDADFFKGTGGFLMPGTGEFAELGNIRFKRM